MAVMDPTLAVSATFSVGHLRRPGRSRAGAVLRDALIHPRRQLSVRFDVIDHQLLLLQIESRRTGRPQVDESMVFNDGHADTGDTPVGDDCFASRAISLTERSTDGRNCQLW